MLPLEIVGINIKRFGAALAFMPQALSQNSLPSHAGEEDASNSRFHYKELIDLSIYKIQFNSMVERKRLIYHNYRIHTSVFYYLVNVNVS